MTTTLWLIRHGETDWNRNGLYQGQADIPLNATGLTQARAAAEELARVERPFTALYSSPLLRARQTAAETALRLGCKVHEDQRLMEIHQGEWTGKNYLTVVAQFGDPLQAAGMRDTLNSRAPGGESVAEVAARMRAAADEISTRHPNGDVLVFTHGLALATLYCQSAGISLEEVYHHIPHNGQVIIIKWSQ
jgi:broad specificity phosphatase PhoE